VEQRSAAGLNWEIGGLSDCFVSTVWDGNVKERACTPRATFFLLPFLRALKSFLANY
jgi:hypothetical protein